MKKKNNYKYIKPYRYAIVFTVLLVAFSVFILLDTFVIPKSVAKTNTSSNAYTSSSTAINGSASSTTSNTNATITDTSYEDDAIKISISTEEDDGTTFYVADIQVTDSNLLKTALAQNTYGRNIKELTSEMAEEHNAIFAINGDYYGFRDAGFVIRNGVLYRDTGDSTRDDLVIDSSGNFSIVNEGDTTAQTLLDGGAQQVLSFGPVLVEDGEVAVSTTAEVSQAMTSNPRTAIGQIGENHYIIIVADGRTNESEGFSLYQLAEQFKSHGATIAYNLDGGGSSTMWFNGEIINNPTSGRSIKEREVSDIIYIGY